MPFLPKDFKVPSTSDYLNKWPQGKTKFRILADAISGYEYWTNDKKVFRSHEPFKETPDAKEAPTFFVAFPIWNYSDKRVQILEIKQKSIINAITQLANDEDWGDPTKYDITVTRIGTSKEDTEYTITPVAPTKLSKEIQEEIEARPVNVEALFDNADPFGGDKPANTGKMKPAYDKDNYPSEGLKAEDIPF